MRHGVANMVGQEGSDFTGSQKEEDKIKLSSGLKNKNVYHVKYSNSGPFPGVPIVHKNKKKKIYTV